MSMKAFRTDKGSHIHILPITITIGTSAHIRCMLFTSASVYDKVYTLEGDDYARWGADDDYIKNWICDQEPYLGRPVPDVDASGNPIIYAAPATTAAPATSQIFYDDTRSVHNDADLQKITTLEEQMVEQQRLVSQLKSILISKGMI